MKTLHYFIGGEYDRQWKYTQADYPIIQFSTPHQTLKVEQYCKDKKPVDAKDYEAFLMVYGFRYEKIEAIVHASFKSLLLECVPFHVSIREESNNIKLDCSAIIFISSNHRVTQEEKKEINNTVFISPFKQTLDSWRDRAFRSFE